MSNQIVTVAMPNGSYVIGETSSSDMSLGSGGTLRDAIIGSPCAGKASRGFDMHAGLPSILSDAQMQDAQWLHLEKELG